MGRTKLEEDTITSEVEIKIKKMLEEAERKAQEIIENAINHAANIDGVNKNVDNTKIDLAVEENERYMNELVEIELFKDDKEYKDDVFVRVNDRTFQIKRGERVKVPRFVKDVIENSKNQESAAIRYQEGLQDKYEATLN